MFLILSCNKNAVLEEYSSENNCSVEYSDRNIVTEDNRVIIFDGTRPNSKYLFKFISYEFKKNILYIYLKEEKKEGTFLQVESYPCIIFKINSIPDKIMVDINYLNKKYK